MHLALDLLSFHLRRTRQLLHPGLIGKALLIDTIDGIADKMIILCHQHRVLGNKREERYLVVNGRQFRYNLYPLPLFFRQLILHLKCPDTVNILSKEINTVRIFTTIGIDVKNGATLGKLTRFVDIIDLVEAELT